MKTMTWNQWKAKHDDFKTMHADGSATCLDMDPVTGATISVPVRLTELTDADRAELRDIRVQITRDKYQHHACVAECEPDGAHTECEPCRYGTCAYTIDSAPCLDCWNGGGDGTSCYWRTK